MHLSMIVPCYNGQKMLDFQVAYWKTLENRKDIEFIVIDDGSFPEIKFDGTGLNAIFARILVDIPWNIAGARNLGAKLASAPWLLFADLDRTIPEETLKFCLDIAQENNANKYHLFAQKLNGEIIPKKPVGTHLVSAEKYWIADGNDEDFSGTYGYQAQHFLKKLKFLGVEKVKNNNVFITNYESYEDASCSLPKDLSRNARIYIDKVQTKKIILGEKIRFPWREEGRWTV